MAEAQLQKLKVTELKELLHKHELPQTGKKDELVKRLLENNIAPESADDEELVGADTDTPAAAAPAENTAPSSAPVPPAATSTSEATPAEPAQSLTPEQQAMKARAERFGIAFNPNATSTARTKPAPAAPAAASSATPAAAPAPAAPKKEKAGAIDKAPLGISDEVLAKRAAKFGLPEKKEPQAAPAAAAKPVSAAAAPKPEAELTPEQKEKLAADEEKKRKRAEKFGTAKPANGIESEGTDAKKAKV